MPAVEVAEEELRRLKALETTLNTIVKNPKAARLVERAHKMVDDKAPTPRLDADALEDERVSGQQKRIDALEKQIADDKGVREQNDKLIPLKARRDAGFAELRQTGWTKEGIEGVEKIMEEQGILDPAIAAAYFEKLHPPQEPVQPGGVGSWNFFEAPPDTAEDLKKLVETKGESNGLVDKMAREAITDARGPARR